MVSPHSNGTATKTMALHFDLPAFTFQVLRSYACLFSAGDGIHSYVLDRYQVSSISSSPHLRFLG